MNKIVFAAIKKSSGGEKKMAWHGLGFLDLFIADVDEEGAWEEFELAGA